MSDYNFDHLAMVLRYLLKNNGCTREDIVKETSLRPYDISQVLRVMIDKKAVKHVCKKSKGVKSYRYYLLED